MSGNGVDITGKPPLALLTHIFGMHSENGVKTTGPALVDSVAQQMVDGGPIKAEFDEVKATVKPPPPLSVDLATTTNISLSGEQTIDGTLTSASKVQVNHHADPTKRGPWLSGAGTWTRVESADTGEELFGRAIYVIGGTANGGKTFMLQNATVPEVGTDPLLFGQVAPQQNTAIPAALDALRAVATPVASATSTDIDDVDGDYVEITGDTDIEEFVLDEGRERWLLFSDDPAPRIVVGATLIGDNGGDDVQMSVGDMVLAKGEAGGVVRFRTFPARPIARSDDVGGADLTDKEGNLYARFTGAAHYYGSVKVEYDNPNGFEFCDREHNLDPSVHGYPTSGDDPVNPDVNIAALEPLIGPIIAGWDGEQTVIHIENILRDRNNGRFAQAEILGQPGFPGEYRANDRGETVLKFDTAQVGEFAYLAVRPRNWTGDEFWFLDLVVGGATKTPGGEATFTFLPIGDSFTDNAGAYYLQQALNTRGYTATSTGTILGDDQNGVGADDPEYDGNPSPGVYTLKGEGHSGWELGGITGHDPDGSYIGGPGGPADVAAYFALTQVEMQNVNAFLREEEVGDDPEDIVGENTVFDLDLYFTRFAEGQPGVPAGRGVVPPDVYVIGFGTNDTNAQPAATIRDYADVRLQYLVARILDYDAAAKIVFWVPGTPRDPARDLVWTNGFTEFFLGLQDARITLAYGDLFIAPIFAHMPTDGPGFSLRSSTAPDPGSGARLTGYNLNLHPFTSARPTMFTPLAAYIAAAHTGEF